VLIVDDGSTDRTARIADAYCSVNPNFRLLSQPNQGLGAVRNRGIENARGEHVTFCDADDIFLPANHLRLIEQMRPERADIGVGLGFSMIESRTIEDFWDNAIVRRLRQIPPDNPMRGQLKFLLQPSACTKVFRCDYLRDHDIRFTVGRLFEDVEFTTAALVRTGRLAYSDLPLFIYDVARSGSITTNTSTRRLEIFENLGPVIALANRAGLSGAQNLCLLTALMRTMLWCLDHVPREMTEAFGLRLLQTVVQFQLRLNADDRRVVEPLMRDRWDVRAFDIVKAVWLSDADAPTLIEKLRSVREGG
jgi:glycosyltransferase involved in cell wall biosynthesis